MESIIQSKFEKLYIEATKKNEYPQLLLKNKLLLDIDIENLNLQGVTICKSTFSNCHFKECDFSGALLTENHYTNSSFITCNLFKTNLNDSKISGENIFENCDFMRSDIQCCEFPKTSFVNSSFRSAFICQSSFMKADFTNCNFFRCFLGETDVRYANLKNTNFNEARILQSHFFNDRKFYFENINTKEQENIDFSLLGDGSEILEVDVFHLLQKTDGSNI